MANEQKAKKDKKSQRPSLGERLKSFFGGLKTELRRVMWPDRKKLKLNTATVLTIIVVAAVMIFVFDQLVQGLLHITGFYQVKGAQAAQPAAVTETVGEEPSASQPVDASALPSETDAEASETKGN